MLVELIVENYAVVERSRIQFHRGLNLLTGETGSGKSIVVDSLGLLLGARSSGDLIRTGAAKARVSGVFKIVGTAPLRAMLDEAGIDFEEGEVIVEREIAAAGKSRAFVGNRPVTTAFLRQLAPSLADIHGQNDQMLLFEPQRQRDVLDNFARAAEAKERVRAAYERWNEARRGLEELRQNEQEKLRLLDLWRFQRNEIEAQNLQPGEDETLENERRILQNTTKLQENASGAFEILYEAPESAIAALRRGMKRVDELSRIDDNLSGTPELLKQAEIAIQEASWTLRDYLDKLEADPARLEAVESRLDQLDRLKRKYGGTVESVLAFLEDARQQLDRVENAAEHQAALERALAAAAGAYEKAALELSEKRKQAADALSRQVEAELKGLAMGGTRFQVSLRPCDWSAAGMEEVEFLVSPNRGEELRPMGRIASGGELSRISLALKTAMGEADRSDEIHTLVFDEVDAGVGGAAAASVGRRLKLLSASNQVICVTHLAQIAGFADHHYAVTKAEKKGRATTEVVELDQEQRAREIARMLSGEVITKEALKQAEQLMQAGKAQ